MTSRQRLLAAMRFEKVDRVPVAPFGLGRLDPGSAIAAELIATTDPFIEVGVPGNVFVGAACEREWRVEGDVTTDVTHTPLGDLTRVVRTTGITSACVEFPVKTPEDAERFLSIPYVPHKVDASVFHERRRQVDEQGLVLCAVPDAICLPAELLSPEDFCLWWIDYPDLMRRLVSTASDRANEWVRRLSEAGVDAFRIIGGEYASVQLGPRGFDELVLEQDRELVNIIHGSNAIAYYHNHGPVMRYLSRFLEIGMDALDPLEAPPWGDADLAAAREQCGERVAFVGNLDDMEVIDKLDAEQVKSIATERMEAAGARGFILGGTASGTYSEKAARNFIALADVVESFAAKAR